MLSEEQSISTCRLPLVKRKKERERAQRIPELVIKCSAHEVGKRWKRWKRGLSTVVMCWPDMKKNG